MSSISCSAIGQSLTMKSPQSESYSGMSSSDEWSPAASSSTSGFPVGRRGSNEASLFLAFTRPLPDPGDTLIRDPPGPMGVDGPPVDFALPGMFEMCGQSQSGNREHAYSGTRMRGEKWRKRFGNPEKESRKQETNQRELFRGLRTSRSRSTQPASANSFATRKGTSSRHVNGVLAS